MPSVKLPRGDTLLLSSPELPVEGWWSHPFTVLLQGKQCCSLFFPVFYKEKGAGDQSKYLPPQPPSQAKCAVPNRSQGPWSSSPGPGFHCWHSSQVPTALGMGERQDHQADRSQSGQETESINPLLSPHLSPQSLSSSEPQPHLHQA